MLETAKLFGSSLDKDDFNTTKKLLSADCIYDMGNQVLQGAENIVSSYEQNMLAGRSKMDKLEWGQSSIDVINDNEFFVNFTDYLFHKNEQYIHRCKQKLTINKNGKISKIEHILDKAKHQRLQKWYKSVGIPTL